MVEMLVVVDDQLMKSDVDNHRPSVNVISECRQLSDSSPVIADHLAGTCQRYEVLASDVDSRLSQLSVIEPRWKHFDESVHDISDWLTAQHDTVSQLLQTAHGPAMSQAAQHCQVSEPAILILLLHYIVFVVINPLTPSVPCGYSYKASGHSDAQSRASECPDVKNYA